MSSYPNLLPLPKPGASRKRVGEDGNNENLHQNPLFLLFYKIFKKNCFGVVEKVITDVAPKITQVIAKTVAQCLILFYSNIDAVGFYNFKINRDSNCTKFHKNYFL